MPQILKLQRACGIIHYFYPMCFILNSPQSESSGIFSCHAANPIKIYQSVYTFYILVYINRAFLVIKLQLDHTQVWAKPVNWSHYVTNFNKSLTGTP
jgi:hypothetical protein